MQKKVIDAIDDGINIVFKDFKDVDDQVKLLHPRPPRFPDHSST